VVAVDREILDHRPNPREVRVPRVGGRSVDADEQQACPAQQLVHVGGEGDPLRVAPDQLRQLGLVDRDFAAREGLHLLGKDVPRDDLVTELGEAGRGDQPDPAHSDHTDRFQFLAHRLLLPFFVDFFFGSSTSAERAIPTICSLVSDCSRSLAIQ